MMMICVRVVFVGLGGFWHALKIVGYFAIFMLKFVFVLIILLFKDWDWLGVSFSFVLTKYS